MHTPRKWFQIAAANLALAGALTVAQAGSPETPIPAFSQPGARLAV